MPKKDLSIRQRLIVSLLYVVTIIAILRLFSHSFAFLSGNSPYGLIFVSAALLLVFGTYITEPYFTRPVDTITNSTAIILALISVQDKSKFIAYNYFFALAVATLVFGLITVVFVKEPRPRWQRFIYLVVTRVGASKFAFTVMYILTLLSFFTKNAAEFWALLTFLILLLSQIVLEDLVRFGTRLVNLFATRNYDTALLGVAIGKENPFLFKVEVNSAKNSSKAIKVGSLVYIQGEGKKALLGVVANEKSLINGTWLTVYLLVSNSKALCFDFGTQTLSKTDDLFSPNNYVFSLDIDTLEEETKKEVLEDNIYKNSSQIVGYVAQGSNINRVKFETLPDLSKGGLEIQEGTIVQIKIGKDTCLYQIIDAQTDEEALEKHNSTGYTTGIAQKLGKYIKATKELSVVKWLPEIYTPVYLAAETRQRSTDNLSIGLLPGTKLDIAIKDVDSLVTHNTAVLGILGIGKSVLTFELIQKVLSSTTSKVICFDITNEYKNQLPSYTTEAIIADDENAFNSINTKFEYIHEVSNKQDFTKSGNVDEYRKEVRKTLLDFFFDSEEVPTDGVMTQTKRIRIFNPDYHKVSKGEKVGFNVITTELTQAEKVRIISEEAFRILMRIGVEAELKARVVLVFEEAHSLIPEWNSTANEGDKSAVNGTAKVILQGRKYGLGSFIVTQRTANISKSILNQCNTIFALRVFDDTGKHFLENYVGSDYANALPTLEERHAVVVGKALRLKQPIIIQLNDRANITLPPTEDVPEASEEAVTA
jgi:hypothetical protein